MERRKFALAKWLIDKTDGQNYRTGKLFGKKHPRQMGMF